MNIKIAAPLTPHPASEPPDPLRLDKSPPGVSAGTSTDALRQLAATDPALARRAATQGLALAALAAAPQDFDPGTGQRFGFGSSTGDQHDASARTLDRGSFGADAVVLVDDGTLTVVAVDGRDAVLEPVATRLGFDGLPDVRLVFGTQSRRMVPVDRELGRDLRALRELFLLSIELGILDGFSERSTDFLRHRARAWYGVGIDRAADDPHTLRAIGRFQSQLAALRELWRDAVAGAEAARADGGDARAVFEHRTAVARHFAATIGPALVSGVIEVLGAPATDRGLGFDAPFRDLAALRALEPSPWPRARLTERFVATFPLYLSLDVEESLP